MSAPQEEGKAIRLGLLGCGVVGSGVVRISQENRAMIAARLGAELRIGRIAVRHPERRRDIDLRGVELSADPMEVVRAADVDVVVELMGGVDDANRCVRQALELGKHVVTANKALIAEHGHELIALAEEKRVDLYFEAAVAGGIPILRVLREALAADRIVALRGIVNGTSNYILSRMAHDRLEFAEALRQAQNAGYAEADPSLDVNGGDARHKLAILASIAFGVRINPDDIPVQGIERLEAIDLRFAARLGFAIKPLAVGAWNQDESALDLRVLPALIAQDDVLAGIHGAMNAVHVEGAMVGPCLLSGLGAGALPTATSVVGDLVDVGRNVLSQAQGRVPSRAVRGDRLRTGVALMSHGEAARYYLRFVVRDRPGVLAHLSGVLGRFHVSIEAMVQEGQGAEGHPVSIVMLTHLARGENLECAAGELDAYDQAVEPVRILRVA